MSPTEAGRHVPKTHKDAVPFKPVDWTGLYPPALPAKVVPEHVAIVMDGNGRWANGKGLTRIEGHKAGEASLLDVVADDVAPPGSPRLEPKTLQLLSALLTGDWAAVESSDERQQSQASGVVAAYTQFHLERTLRSLQHVDRSTA